MAPYRRKKPAPTDYTTDEEDLITYDVEEEELEPDPTDKFAVMEYHKNNPDKYIRALTPTRFRKKPKYAKLKEKYTMFDGVDFDKILVKYPKKKKKIMLELFEKFGKKRTLFSSDTKEFITVDDLDPSCKNVVVLDDCMTDKDQKSIANFFVRGRKKNATIIYLSQSYYKTPIIIRRNCNYLIFFNLQQREIQQIISEFDGSLTKEEFSRLYKKCMQQPYDFFMLDLVNPALRYKKKYFIPINKDGRVFSEENLRIQKKLPPLS
ncbi:uncharacterized protein TNCV_3298761 [Trichonephila clavipes]|uniref:Uncharacterized protein n=1 Tax=Trichonephila clavipes TaxID=2585209 RepID=A0A8X7B7K7_TRICX|nr:uncharacterized protein TNCV_3298761 [Trichonephila clavipes]